MRILNACVLGAALLAPISAVAATIGADDWAAELIINGDSTLLASSFVDPVNSAAGFGDNFDIIITWVDGNSFDVSLLLFNTDALDLSLELTGLDFTDGGPIQGASFNRPASDVDSFLVDNPAAVFIEPVVSFTETSVLAIWGYNAALGADGPRLRFDVDLGDEDPTAIPLPAGGVLLVTALAVLGAARLRRR